MDAGTHRRAASHTVSSGHACVCAAHGPDVARPGIGYVPRSLSPVCAPIALVPGVTHTDTRRQTYGSG
jgi:hypothetical protein